MKKIKTLIVSHGAALGGSPISALNIGRYIDKTQFEIIYLFGEKREIDEVAKSEGFKTYSISNKGFLGSNLIYQTLKIIIREKIDIVHLNTLTSYYKYPAIAAKLFGKKVVWFVRENPEEKRCVRLKNYLNALADRIVTVSYDTANHIYYADKKKLTTIHNGLNLDYRKQKDREELLSLLGLENRKYITTIASLESRKGILEVIEAFSMTEKELGDYKLLVVGEDRSSSKRYLFEIKTLISKKKLEDRVVLYGKSKYVNELLSITDIFVLASSWEGLSRVLLEAMACSLPIIASDAGGNREQIEDGVNGYLFKKDSSGDLAKKLQMLAFEDLEKFGQKSREIFEDRFDIKETTLKIENLYKSLQ